MRILLGSHGHLASGMKTSLEILIGGDSKKVQIIDAYVNDMNIDNELENFFKNIDKEETVLMLSDLYGGSVNQKMYLYLDRPHTYLVAGINLAFLIEVCMRENISDEELEQLVKQAREMQRVVKYEESSQKEETDEFF